MPLTIGDGFPFGLRFKLALLILVAVRAPYVNGWIGDPVRELRAAPFRA